MTVSGSHFEPLVGFYKVFTWGRFLHESISEGILGFEIAGPGSGPEPLQAFPFGGLEANRFIEDDTEVISGVIDAIFRGFAKPFDGLGGIIDFVINDTEIERGKRVSTAGGFGEPTKCLGLALLESLAIQVEHTEVVLGFDHAILSGLEVPTGCGGNVLFYAALTHLINISQQSLGIFISIESEFFIELGCLRNVRRDVG